MNAKYCKLVESYAQDYGYNYNTKIGCKGKQGSEASKQCFLRYCDKQTAMQVAEDFGSAVGEAVAHIVKRQAACDYMQTIKSSEDNYAIFDEYLTSTFGKNHQLKIFQSSDCYEAIWRYGESYDSAYQHFPEIQDYAESFRSNIAQMQKKTSSHAYERAIPTTTIAVAVVVALAAVVGYVLTQPEDPPAGAGTPP